MPLCHMLSVLRLSVPRAARVVLFQTSGSIGATSRSVSVPQTRVWCPPLRYNSYTAG